MFENQLKTDVIETKRLILQMTVAAHNAKIELLNSDFSALQNNPDHFIYCVLDYYKKLAFFPSEEIKAIFKEFGFKKRELAWFTDLQTIQKELVDIENSQKIIVFPYHVLSIIVLYTELKIVRAVFDWANRKYGRKYLSIFKKFFKQRRYHDALNKNSRPKHVLNKPYEKAIAQIEDKEFLDDFLMKANKGKVDSVLIPLLFEAGFYPKRSRNTFSDLLSEHEFIWILFPLVEHIMKEKNFMTEYDFFRLKKKEGKDYRLYIIRSIKKIGKRTCPFKDYIQAN